jgi:hypothetical protein
MEGNGLLRAAEFGVPVESNSWNYGMDVWRLGDIGRQWWRKGTMANVISLISWDGSF